MRQVASCLVLLLCAGCASSPAAAPRNFRPSEVSELAALPPGYGEGAVVRASCARAARAGSFEDEPLADVDCTFTRLSRVLRARAGERAARLIVGKRCHSRRGARVRLECSATLAVPTSQQGLSAARAVGPGPAPSPEQVLDLDEPRPQDQELIRVGFEPAASGPGAPARPVPRAYSAVEETHLPSVGRQALGQLSARCSGCQASALRYALRVTAGHVGAGEVASVKCFQDAGDLRCVATALAPWSS